MPVVEDIIDLKTVGKMLGLSYSQVLKRADRGELPLWRTGQTGQWRAFRSDIEKFRDEQRTNKRETKELT